MGGFVVLSSTREVYSARYRVLNDAVTTLHWQRGKFELDMSGGWRFPSHTDPSEQWLNASGAFWFARTTALLVSGGKYPEGLVQGFPNVKYAIIGFRLTTPSARRSAARAYGSADERPLPPALGRPAEMIPELFAVVTEHGAPFRTVRIIAPGADRVEIMADFTDWEPMPLEARADGSWQGAVSVPPGTYLVSVRVNGGAWGAPPGVPARRDEFGTDAGVVVIK
jgi:hypothetical protein